MELLYVDDRVVVCVKPSGLLSTDEPGGLPDVIRKALKDENAVVRSVHRLDRPVGGVMVYARTKRAASELSAQIRAGEFHKEYLAVLCGIPERQEGELKDYLIRDTMARRTIIAGDDLPGAREASLSYRMLASEQNTSLVRIRLHTGRTHQIRCQFSARGLPLWGDRKYGAKEGSAVALWSASISFLHPRTGERLRFFAKPPADKPWNHYNTIPELNE